MPSKAKITVILFFVAAATSFTASYFWYGARNEGQAVTWLALGALWASLAVWHLRKKAPIQPPETTRGQ